MTNNSIGEKCGKIIHMFDGGGTQGRVTSVNGETGDVIVDVPVTSVNNKIGDVTIDIPVTSVNGKTGAVTVEVPVTSVNGSVGDVTVVSCNPFPDGTSTGIGTYSGVTTMEFCNSLAKNTSVVAGMMYLGQVRLTEGVNNPSYIPNQSEVTVKCIKAVRNNLNPDDPEDFNGMVILVLDMTSTNQSYRHWMTVYEKFGKQTYDYTQYPNGKIAFGNDSKPWYGMLYSVLGEQAGAPNPLPDEYTAASKADVAVKSYTKSGTGNVIADLALDTSTGAMTATMGTAATTSDIAVKSFTTSGSGNAVTNLSLDSSSGAMTARLGEVASKSDIAVKSFSTSGAGNVVTGISLNSTSGAMTATLGNISSVSESTEDEITTGTASGTFISPRRVNKAVWQGVVNDSTGMALGSENQKKVQNWLGTNTLTFTFSDNTTRTFNFVCNEIIS